MTDRLHTELPPALRRALDLLTDPPANPDIGKGYLDLLTDADALPE
ncbi:MAG TPA: SAM-dependent methyltransferase, partial [Mycobacterium sp.]